MTNKKAFNIIFANLITMSPHLSKENKKSVCEAMDKIENALKALEIIKENLIVSYDESENDKSCLVIGFKVDKDKMAIIYRTFDKEKIDLLKEVLL